MSVHLLESVTYLRNSSSNFNKTILFLSGKKERKEERRIIEEVCPVIYNTLVDVTKAHVKACKTVDHKRQY